MVTTRIVRFQETHNSANQKEEKQTVKGRNKYNARKRKECFTASRNNPQRQLVPLKTRPKKVSRNICSTVDLARRSTRCVKRSRLVRSYLKSKTVVIKNCNERPRPRERERYKEGSRIDYRRFLRIASYRSSACPLRILKKQNAEKWRRT